MKVHYERRPRSGVMLAYPFEERRLLQWPLPYLAQYKYNGLRCLAARTSNGTLLLSSTGLPIHTMPHIEAELGNLPLGIYDGELYIHNNFQKVLSLVNRGNVSPDHREVRFMMFDLKAHTPQLGRLELIHGLQNKCDPEIISIAPFWPIFHAEDISPLLAEAMAGQYEGLILRDSTALYKEKRTTAMMKIKPRSSDTYTIVGYEEEYSIHNEPKGSLGAFWVSDEDGRQFKVGSGFTREQRKQYWLTRDLMIGTYLYVKYPALTDRGVPWSPVFVEVLR